MLHGFKREEMVTNKEQVMLYNEDILKYLKGKIQEFA
jgi:hypothetical protein